MEIKKPEDCSHEELKAFEAMVVAGKQVDPNDLIERLKRCMALGFFYIDGELAGVSAIKQKDKQSVTRTMRKAGLDKNEIPTLELGYSYTKPASRRQGINTQLNDGLLATIGQGRIYATTDSDAMRQYLYKKGFQKHGSSFKGKFNENLDYFEKG